MQKLQILKPFALCNRNDSFEQVFDEKQALILQGSSK